MLVTNSWFSGSSRTRGRARCRDGREGRDIVINELHGCPRVPVFFVAHFLSSVSKRHSKTQC
jgi:hypothetical protein